MGVVSFLDHWDIAGPDLSCEDAESQPRQPPESWFDLGSHRVHPITLAWSQACYPAQLLSIAFGPT